MVLVVDLALAADDGSEVLALGWGVLRFGG